MSYDIVTAINLLAPGATWAINADDYNQIIWETQDIPKPTRAQVDAKIAELKTEYASKEYQRQRAPDYPDIKDQLDAIWKGGDAYNEMLAKVMADKDKYPKPGE